MENREGGPSPEEERNAFKERFLQLETDDHDRSIENYRVMLENKKNEKNTYSGSESQFEWQKSISISEIEKWIKREEQMKETALRYLKSKIKEFKELKEKSEPELDEKLNENYEKIRKLQEEIKSMEEESGKSSEYVYWHEGFPKHAEIERIAQENRIAFSVKAERL